MQRKFIDKIEEVSYHKIEEVPYYTAAAGADLHNNMYVHIRRKDEGRKR